jgi:hypothetical protein
MSRIPLTVFLCTGKDCSRAWRRICDDSPRKWLKRRLEETGAPCKLHIIKTDCMDRCEQAACIHLVHEGRARLETQIHSEHDLGRILEAVLDVLDVPWRLTEGEAGDELPGSPQR